MLRWSESCHGAFGAKSKRTQQCPIFQHLFIIQVEASQGLFCTRASSHEEKCIHLQIKISSGKHMEIYSVSCKQFIF